MSKLARSPVAFVSLLLGLLLTPRLAAAASTCEAAVVSQCVSTTCPAFCGEAGADQAACLAGCTAQDRCKISLFGGQDRKDQVELDTQTRGQLMACLAENRKPIVVAADLDAPVLPPPPADAPKKAAKKKSKKVKKATRGHVSGTLSRRTAWKQLETESFRRRQAGKPRINPVKPVRRRKKAPPTKVRMKPRNAPKPTSPALQK